MPFYTSKWFIRYLNEIIYLSTIIISEFSQCTENNSQCRDTLLSINYLCFWRSIILDNDDAAQEVRRSISQIIGLARSILEVVKQFAPLPPWSTNMDADSREFQNDSRY